MASLAKAVGVGRPCQPIKTQQQPLQQRGTPLLPERAAPFNPPAPVTVSVVSFLPRRHGPTVCAAGRSQPQQITRGNGPRVMPGPPGWGKDPAAPSRHGTSEPDLPAAVGGIEGFQDDLILPGFPDKNGSRRAAALGAVPERWLVVAGMSAAFILCNMDKVNMSVAVLPLAAEFGWSNADRGLVSSAFFWGYALTQVPGGIAASKLGGRGVLLAAVCVWSLGTFVAPLATAVPDHGLAALCASRFLVGLGEGMGPASATAVMAQLVPAGERARAVAITFGGMDLGSVVGLLVVPFLIGEFGWPSVFYTFGAIGFLWCAGWASLGARERGAGEGGGGGAGTLVAEDKQDARRGPTPWLKFARSRPVWGVSALHFSANWGYYTLLAWLPSFFEQGLGQGLEASSRLTMLPYICMLLVTPVVGPLADGLLERGASVTAVRKMATGVHMLVPSACMLGLSWVMSGGLGSPPDHSGECLALLCLAFAAWPFGRAGLYCNAQDLSRRHAGVLLGISNTAGAISGVMGVWAAGHILDLTDSWGLAVFAPAALWNVVGFGSFALLGSGENQGWDGDDERA